MSNLVQFDFWLAFDMKQDNYQKVVDEIFVEILFCIKFFYSSSGPLCNDMLHVKER